MQEHHLKVAMFRISLRPVVMHHTRMFLLNPRLALVPLVERIQAFARVHLTMAAIGGAQVANGGWPGFCGYLAQIMQAAKIATDTFSLTRVRVCFVMRTSQDNR